ncbi:MAG: deoxyribonuclease IV, partial [Oliverpabstia intestinalis]
TVKKETFELAVDFMKLEMERAEAMGSRVLIVHPGAHVGAGAEAGISQIAKALNEVLTRDTKICVALETMAGKGSEIGRTFEEIRAIYDGVHKKERLRVCFDTCHVNDAGYDLVHDYDGVFETFDKVIGLDQIAVFHINDSLNPLGAHKDRHANIGKGTIGFETLYRLVHDPRFVEIPKILETPWLCAEGETKKTIPPYKEEIAQLLAK